MGVGVGGLYQCFVCGDVGWVLFVGFVCLVQCQCECFVFVDFFFGQVDVYGGVGIDVFVEQDYLFGLVFVYQMWQILCVIGVWQQVDGCFWQCYLGMVFDDVQVVGECIFQVVVYCIVVDGCDGDVMEVGQGFEGFVELVCCFVCGVFVVGGELFEIGFGGEEFFVFFGDYQCVDVFVGIECIDQVVQGGQIVYGLGVGWWVVQCYYCDVVIGFDFQVGVFVCVLIYYCSFFLVLSRWWVMIMCMILLVFFRIWCMW